MKLLFVFGPSLRRPSKLLVGAFKPPHVLPFVGRRITSRYFCSHPGVVASPCSLQHFVVNNQSRLYSSTSAVNGDTATTTTTTTTTATNDTKETVVSSFEETPLGKNGRHLMDGLDHYVIPAMDDGHPLSVYGIHSSQKKITTKSKKQHSLKPILLLHGRTWSSVPVYHLLGGPQNRKDGKESRSLMEALYDSGLQPYCMDFRGFGGTPPDNHTGTVEPYRCVQDAETALDWIRKRHHRDVDHHHDDPDDDDPPALLGWSQGALVAQLAAQKAHPKLSKVILYGSIYDPMVRYPREPLYLANKPNRTEIVNQFDDAIEDFTVEGTIPPEPAQIFAHAALVSDPIKAQWTHVYQFNNCDPARVHVPCLVVAGDQDPYAPVHVQQELFCRLGRMSDRTWNILSGSDHAVHLLDGRHRLINTVVSFVMNGKRTEQHQGFDV